MHELSIIQSVVDLCAARAAEQGADARVTHVTLEVGLLAAVLPDALRFCFEVCAKDTRLEGAKLHIIEIPGRARCLDCASDMRMTELYDVCACGSVKLLVLAGQELKIKHMEVEQCA